MLDVVVSSILGEPWSSIFVIFVKEYTVSLRIRHPQYFFLTTEKNSSFYEVTSVHTCLEISHFVPNAVIRDQAHILIIVLGGGGDNLLEKF